MPPTCSPGSNSNILAPIPASEGDSQLLFTPLSSKHSLITAFQDRPKNLARDLLRNAYSRTVYTEFLWNSYQLTCRLEYHHGLGVERRIQPYSSEVMHSEPGDYYSLRKVKVSLNRKMAGIILRMCRQQRATLRGADGCRQRLTV
jgi:hypothetical protein